MRARGRWRGRDDAASDFVGTVLLVLAVVVVGTAFSVVVASNVQRATPPSDASFSLAQVKPGDAALSVLLNNGEPIRLDELRVTLQRNLSAPQEVARASWTTPDPVTLRAGDRIAFPLAPPLAEEEAVTVRVYRDGENMLLASLTARGGSSLPPLPPPVVTVSASPNILPADATATSLVTARVSHPDGTLAVSSLVADVTSAGSPSRLLFPLNDEGRDGDLVGGDGIWSALVRLPTNAPTGTHSIVLTAIDAAGRTHAVGSAPLFATAPAGSGGSGTGGSGDGSGDGTGGDGSSGTAPPGGLIGTFNGNSTGSFSGNASGSFSGNASGNFTGNSTGNHTGNVRGDVDGAFFGVGAGKRAAEGTRFKVPTSTNVTKIRFQNWSWDRLAPARLDVDAMTIHVLAGERTWSAYMKFDYSTIVPKNVPKLVSLRIWNDENETWYRANTGLDLNTLDLNLLDPLEGGQWVLEANNTLPKGYVTNVTTDNGASYRHSKIEDDPFVVIAFMRDEQATGQGSKGLDTGIYAVDVVFI